MKTQHFDAQLEWQQVLDRSFYERYLQLSIIHGLTSANRTKPGLRGVSAYAIITKQPNLKLKTRPKQLLGYIHLAFVLPFRYSGVNALHAVLSKHSSFLLHGQKNHKMEQRTLKNVNIYLNTNIYS